MLATPSLQTKAEDLAISTGNVLVAERRELADLSDGVDVLPSLPGIYCILNRLTGRRGVGMATRSIRARGLDHRSRLTRGVSLNRRMQEDVERFGWQAMFIFPLEVMDPGTMPPSASLLRRRELWWSRQMLADDERIGYNDEAGGVRSTASRFRLAERRLAGGHPCKYCPLPGVRPDTMIEPVLLETWVPNS